MSLHSTRIDIPARTRARVVAILNARLADAIDLSMQAKQAHWNVKGPNFIGLHELFDDVAEHAEGHVDKLAERITTLGGTALGTIRAVGRASSLKAYPEDIFEGRAHVAALAAFAKLTRAAIEATDDLDDEVTSDLFNEITGEADKDLWFLEAHLQAAK
jgi:starvation-inducible DNA-binding protein